MYTNGRLWTVLGGRNEKRSPFSLTEWQVKLRRHFGFLFLAGVLGAFSREAWRRRHMTSGSEAGVNKWAFAEKHAHGLWGKSDVRVNFRRLLRVVSQMSYVNLSSVRVRDFSHKNPKYPVVSKLLYSRLGDLVNMPCMSSFFIIFRWDFIISKKSIQFHKSHCSLS